MPRPYHQVPGIPGVLTPPFILLMFQYTWDIGYCWFASYSYHGMFASVLLSIYIYTAIISKRSPALDVFNARFFQQILIDPIQSLNVSISRCFYRTERTEGEVKNLCIQNLIPTHSIPGLAVQLYTFLTLHTMFYMTT